MTGSAQAVIFFGKEVNMGIKIVLKQYTGVTFDEIIREIKLFTLLEKDRIYIEESKQQNITQVIVKNIQHDGLPQLLGYKI